jgi:hypothetical protein
VSSPCYASSARSTEQSWPVSWTCRRFAARISSTCWCSMAKGYAEDMAAGAVFPAIVLFFDGAEYWLVDGFHRILAALDWRASGQFGSGG